MEALLRRIDAAQSDLAVVEGGQNFNRIRTNKDLMGAWADAKGLASTWIARIKPVASNLDELAVQSVFLFADGLIGIGNGQGVRQGETVTDAIRRLKAEFRLTLPLVAYEVFEASGIMNVSETKIFKWRDETIARVNASVTDAEASVAAAVAEAIVKIRASAEEAARDFESAKAKASKISIDSAQAQFQAAAESFKHKLWFWSFLAGVLFIVLVLTLSWLLVNPPTLVREITDGMRPGAKASLIAVSVPLLVVTSAYFTSIRIAMIGVLGLGLAFSLRMMRAYIHMIEHNQHKLRVTNSIEAFVAAVRTNEQKDLVLSKLVESVTEFGDSGILGKQGEASGLPSVIFEAMTKNVGKAD